MLTRFAHLASILACAWVSTPVAAQPAGASLPAVTGTVVPTAQAGATKASAASVVNPGNGAAERVGRLALAQVAAGRTVSVVSAAGSLIILADGIVAGADMAQIQPPAPGFVYER